MQFSTKEHPVTLGDIMKNRLDREYTLNLVPLLHIGQSEKTLLPRDDLILQEGDKLLFCGQVGVRHSLEWTLQNINVLEYLLTGDVEQKNPVYRFFSKH